jgi:hypothetical protein
VRKNAEERRRTQGTAATTNMYQRTQRGMPNDGAQLVVPMGDMLDDGGFVGQELVTGREVKCLSRLFGGGVLPVVLGGPRKGSDEACSKGTS